MRTCLALALFVAACALAQPAKLEFEAVSIRPSPERTPGQTVNVGCSGGPGTADPGTSRCTNITVFNLVLSAYHLQQFQFSGPESMRDRRFDITEKIPAGTTKEQFSEMLRNMLAEHFKLAVHREMRDMPKYDLVIAKGGSKLKPAKGPDEAADAAMAPGPPVLDRDGYPILSPGVDGSIIEHGRTSMGAPNTTLAQLAARLSRQLGKPVTDATGLPGKFDFSFRWMAVPLGAATDAETGPTLEQALVEQLGLRLASKRGPVEIVVVDHVEKLPTEN